MNKSTKSTKSALKTRKTGLVGRPAYVLNFPRGAFTYADAFAANPKVCKLTVRNRVNEKVGEKFLTRLDRTVKTGEPGKPAFLFIRTAMALAAEARRKNRNPAPAVEAESIVPVVVATEAVNTEVPVEAPVEDPTVVAGPEVEVAVAA